MEMDMESVRRRRARKLTEEQLEVMITFMERNRAMDGPGPTGALGPRSVHIHKWDTLTGLLNGMPGTRNTRSGWRKCWSNLKCKAKALSEDRWSGGPPTAFQERVANLLYTREHLGKLTTSPSISDTSLNQPPMEFVIDNGDRRTLVPVKQELHYDEEEDGFLEESNVSSASFPSFPSSTTTRSTEHFSQANDGPHTTVILIDTDATANKETSAYAQEMQQPNASRNSRRTTDEEVTALDRELPSSYSDSQDRGMLGKMDELTTELREMKESVAPVGFAIVKAMEAMTSALQANTRSTEVLLQTVQQLLAIQMLQKNGTNT